MLEQPSFARAELAQRKSGERIDLVLSQLGLVSENDLFQAMARYLSMPIVSNTDVPAEPLFPGKLDQVFLRNNKVLPIAEDEVRIRIAMADPFNVQAVNAISYLLDRSVERCVISPADFEKAMETLYGGALRNDLQAAEPAAASEEDVQRLKDIASEAPVIRLVNRLIADAVEQRASDIHVEPLEDAVRVRFRLDGALHTAETLPLNMHSAVASRIKIIANLNIAERRLPQDGRTKLAVRGKDVDLRISTTPTMFGESVVLRILDRSAVALNFRELGFTGRVLDRLQEQLHRPNGIVLVTGPTGSGKTTTLYTALLTLNSADQKIFSVEDPVEYQLRGINQMQVQPKIGLSFATALRSILRQDPDIIMIGEIRDLETAQIAIQASLTGHLVLSTLHTNNAPATVTRLLDMGVEDYLLTSTITGIMAQRLVRRLCGRCAEPAQNINDLADRIAGADLNIEVPENPTFRQARGCEGCRNTGYDGRMCISELLLIDEEIRRLVMRSASEGEISRYAASEGFTTMYEDGLGRVFDGQTTLEEVMRVTRSN